MTGMMMRALSLLFVFSLISACSIDQQAPQILGNTMGTTYSVQWHPQNISASELKQTIETRLIAINQVMSTYDAQSQLSQFNASRETGWHAVDTSLAAIVLQAQDITQKSLGAFDISVGPLVNLWGFGPDQTEFGFPTPTEINIAMRSVGS